MTGVKQVSVAQKGNHLLIENGLVRIRCHLDKGGWDLEMEDVGEKTAAFRASGFFSCMEVNGEWVGTMDLPVESWKEKKIHDSLGKGRRIDIEYRADGKVELMQVLRVYSARPSVFLGLRVRNGSGQLIRVGEVRPVEADGLSGSSMFLGEGVENARVFRESNNVCASVVRSIKDSGSDGAGSGDPFGGKRAEGDAGETAHRSGWLGLIFNPKSGTAFLGGFMSVDVALGKTVTRYDPARGIVQWYASCKYDGYELEPGHELRTERCYIDVRPDPFDSLETFSDVVAMENGLPAVGPSPALWCSWYPYRLKLTEEEALKNAEVIARRFRHYGVRVVQLDYGWNDKDTPGNWSNNKERFPHGLRWLAEKLGSMGLELGLWIAPFTIFKGSDFYTEHPDCVIRDQQGRPSPWQTAWPWEPKQDIFDLDVHRAESKEFIERTFRELKDTGVTYFKMDFLNGPSTAPLCFTNGIRNDDRVRDGERVRTGLSLVRKAVGDSAYLLACNLPHSHSLGIVDAVFDSMDVGNSYFDRDEGWKHFRRRTSGLACRYYQQKRLWHNDPDVIYVGGNPPDFLPVSSQAEARLRTTAVALSGGPVLLGDNLAKLPEERLDMYTLCLPSYGRPARPLDMFTRDHSRIWDLEVRTGWGKWRVIGLFNYETEAASIPVDFSALGFHARQSCLVWEFWERAFLGVHREGLSVEVPARDVRVIAVKESTGVPQLLSTTFHLTQGGVEVPELRWDPRERTLHGSCTRAPGSKGELVFSVPEAFPVLECACDGVPVQPRLVAPEVWAMTCVFAGDTVRWSIRFGG